MDFELPEGEDSCWVTVGPWSVYIKKTDEGIAVDLYPQGGEMEEAVSGCWALDDDLLQDATKEV